jgi:hypothetical protein
MKFPASSAAGCIYPRCWEQFRESPAGHNFRHLQRARPAPAFAAAVARTNVNRVNLVDPHIAQTGPARRHDDQTLEMQHRLLSGHPDWQKIYDLMSVSIKAAFPKA